MSESGGMPPQRHIQHHGAQKSLRRRRVLLYLAFAALGLLLLAAAAAIALLVVRVRNPNPAAFRHGPADTALYYRGAAVGSGEVPAGTVPSRGGATVRMNMTVQADRVVAAAGIGGLVADVVAGEMEFEARTEVPGTVTLLGIVKRGVEARSVCRVVIGVADVSVRRQECHNEARL